MSTYRLLTCASTLAIAGALAGNPVFAQDDSATQSLEEIIVTGTRLRGAVAPVGSAVISIDREYIDKSSAVSVDKLIQETPQIFNLGVSESSRGQSGGSGNITYGNSVNLRGIGPFSTLVLLDGHRAVTNGRNIEPSVIPTLALERIEIVPDGASAIYGSDAVAGVINLVLRRNVDGGRVMAQYGTGEDFDQDRLGLSWGKTWESGQFFGAIEKSTRSNLSGDDRDFFTANQSATDYRTNQCSPGTIIADGVSYAIPEGGVTPATAGSLQPGTQNLCETQPGQDLLPEQDYVSAAFTFNQRLTDQIEFLADGFYNKRKFEFTDAYDRGALTVPSSNAFFVDPTGSGLDRVTVPYSFINDLPSDGSSGYNEAWELTGGFKFQLPAEWQLEVLGTYGENTVVSNSTRGLDSRDLATALASSNPATAFDPFGLHRTSDATLQAISDQIFLVDTVSDFTGAEARVDGPLFKLPGGEVLLAAGYEYQKLDYLPSLARGNPGTPYRCGQCEVAGVSILDREVDSYYAEIMIPIVGDGNAMPGIQSLNFKAALRHDKYSDVGNTTNPQFGLDWEPVAGLKFRASYGESFRAPLITDLYGNSSAMFVELFPDPTIGGAPRVGVFQSGGNPDIGPETATTKTFGVDWEPEFLPGGRLSLTYFDIEYENQIAIYLGDNNILNREQAFDGTGIILRDEAAAQRIQELFDQGLTVARGVLPDPVTLYVDGRPNNLGVSNTKGLDFQFLYNWSHPTGDYLFNLGGMYITDYEVSATPKGELVDRRNTIFNPNKLKLRASATWEKGIFGAQLVANHISSYDNNLATPVQDVDSYNPVDLRAWVELGDPDGRGMADAWLVSLDATNLFDEDPPYVDIAPTNNGSGGFDATLTNPVGRVVSLTVSKNF